MSRDPMFLFWVLYAFLCKSVCFVPSPTNVSVVCHNFMNILYWNYSKPTEQMKFSVTVKPYTEMSQTIETSRMFLDISKYSPNVDADYFVTVRAHDEQEESKKVSIKFTYNLDFVDKNVHKCFVDFPLINASVHKDVINVSFPHPYYIHTQDSLLNVFTYKVTHDERETLYECYEDEELCTAEIHLFQSLVGKCTELKFEGTADVLFTTAYKNVCISVMPDAPVDSPSSIAGFIGVGVVILFIVVGFVFLLSRKWSKIPKLPHKFVIPPRPATIPPPLGPAFSVVSPTGHSPLLEPEEPLVYDRPTVSPPQRDTTFVPTDMEISVVSETSDTSEGDVNFEEPENYGKSSDYDSPKFLQEMSPGDFTTGYGPRPPVI